MDDRTKRPLHIPSVVHYNCGQRAHPKPRETFLNYMNTFSVRFLRHEQASYGTPERFFYQVTAARDIARIFTVWIDARQESIWGTGVKRTESGLVGACEAAITEWCQTCIDRLPADGQTSSIDLNEIRLR
jgi:hypothetical protein